MFQAQHSRDPADNRRRRPDKDGDRARFCVRIERQKSMVVHELDRRHVKDQLGVTGGRPDTLQGPQLSGIPTAQVRDSKRSFQPLTDKFA